MKIEQLKNKNIAILWFWKEGRSTLEFLKKNEFHNLTILDKDEIILDEKNNHVTIVSGEKYLDSLSEFDYIFKSPGICPFQEKLEPYRDKFISQTQIFFDNYDWKVIGITGTKWKSTVSTLLYRCLAQAWFDVKLVGNIWKPVLEEIDIASHKRYDYIVYEMSSYMLQDFVPKLYIGLFNNIFPCHLDWHKSWEVYLESKLNILQNSHFKLINGEFSELIPNKNLDPQYIYFNTKGKYTYSNKWFCIDDICIYPDDDIALEWEHNRKNISGVIAVLDIILQEKEQLKKLLHSVLPTFYGLPDRIEHIGTYEDILFINDAIATTPESTIAAIDTFDTTLQTLFLWGENSGFQFHDLRKKILASPIQNIIAFPDTSELVFPEIQDRDYEVPFELEISGKFIQFLKTKSMKSGVDFAYKTTLPGRIALLSCGAPSFSLWKNYRQKADQFKSAVENY